MKNALCTVLFLSLGLAAARTPALAQSAIQSAARTIAMSGRGGFWAAPDTVTLSAGVTSSAATAAAALAANSTRMQSVFAALKRSGVDDTHMQTANFSIAPQYANTPNGEAPRLTGYQVSNQLQVRLDTVASLGATLDALVGADANQINGVEFSIRDSAALLAQARQKAVADARARAQTYALAAGVTLGPILSISEADNQGPRPLYMAAPMLRAAKAPPVAAGEESVNATVSIIWEIR